MGRLFVLRSPCRVPGRVGRRGRRQGQDRFHRTDALSAHGRRALRIRSCGAYGAVAKVGKVAGKGCGPFGQRRRRTGWDTAGSAFEGLRGIGGYFA